MDEYLSWRARLLKSNINITRVDFRHALLYVDFAYRPRSGMPQKWGKTITDIKQYQDMTGTICNDWEKTADNTLKDILSLRKELEG